jgi:polysaccharide export outer membrane protein
VAGLFSGSVATSAQSSSMPAVTPGTAPPTNPTGSGTAQTLPALVVDTDGELLVPYAGKIHVAGLRADEAAGIIRRALHGKAIDPQVTVTVVSSHANSVAVLGEVRTPGRFQLAPHNDRLLDLLALAGGPVKPAPDLALAVYRGEQRVEVPLSLVMDDPTQNIRLGPEDRVLLLDRPRTYSTFGALGQNNTQQMLDNRLTLADAISKGGGLDTYSANGASVLLFRFERPEVARALGVTLPPAAKGVPIVYRVNFRQPAGLFAANNFDIKPQDMLYVSRADLFEAKKFLDLVNSVTQIGYNARLTASSVVP